MCLEAEEEEEEEILSIRMRKEKTTSPPQSAAGITQDGRAGQGRAFVSHFSPGKRKENRKLGERERRGMLLWNCFHVLEEGRRRTRGGGGIGNIRISFHFRPLIPLFWGNGSDSFSSPFFGTFRNTFLLRSGAECSILNRVIHRYRAKQEACHRLFFSFFGGSRVLNALTSLFSCFSLRSYPEVLYGFVIKRRGERAKWNSVRVS